MGVLASQTQLQGETPVVTPHYTHTCTGHKALKYGYFLMTAEELQDLLEIWQKQDFDPILGVYMGVSQ